MNQASDDHQRSHLHKGGGYDDELPANAWTAYTAQHELNIVGEVIKKFFNGRAKRCMDFACGTGRVTEMLQNLAEECGVFSKFTPDWVMILKKSKDMEP